MKATRTAKSKRGPAQHPRGRRRLGAVKKTAPTTVRLRPILHAWVRAVARTHDEGQSGVINDALAFYMDHVERKGEVLYKSIVGAGGNGYDREKATNP